jgi:hypothetical protein
VRERKVGERREKNERDEEKSLTHEKHKQKGGGEGGWKCEV